MSSADVTAQQIFDAIQRVPEEYWPDVLRTIEGFQTKQSLESSGSRVRTGTDLHGSELIGVWADRTDISNGQDFARSLRRQAEQRNEGSANASGH